MKHISRLLLVLVAASLCACVASEELMIGSGNSLGFPAQKMPTSPASIAALAGNKVYRYRQFLLGGDHIIKTSNGSEYNHALTASFKDFLQAAGFAYATWSTLQQQLAQISFDKFLAGEITERQLNDNLKQIELGKLDVLKFGTPNPNDGLVE